MVSVKYVSHILWVFNSKNSLYGKMELLIYHHLNLPYSLKFYKISYWHLLHIK